MTHGEPVDIPPPGTGKEEFRRWARRMRRPGIPEDQAAATVDGIVEWLAGAGLPAGSVVIYLPLPDEIDVTRVPDRVGRTFAVTRTPPSGPLTLHPLDAPRERHRFGFEQPVATAPLVDLSSVAVVLTPGLAFGPDGERLGRGGGYYDRFLLTVPDGAARVGVTVSALVVDRLPTDSHDVPMTHLATETGVRPVSTPGGTTAPCLRLAHD
ncbi:MAG: 5-formyltetrahydrofolate cyclo-ligase [bacterium]|nr:5-formyltetrahydrofolate cyclo-ligase [bacterium]MDE0351082.1 5-formyltetrahydrofolate cyclo-ligase [bacterium]